MKPLLSLCFAILTALAIVATGNAGDKKKTDDAPPKVELGPEHKVLQSLTGTFEAKVKLFLDPKAKPAESAGVMTRQMILDGNFLQENYIGQFFGKDFRGMGVMGYDANKDKFVNTWFDNMTTSTMILQGNYDVRKKAFTMVGEDFDPNTKKKMKARDVLRIVSADVQVLDMYRQPAGVPEEFKVMEITFTRKK